MSGHNGWNEIHSMIMIHQCMEELGAFITILKEVALDLLTKNCFSANFIVDSF